MTTYDDCRKAIDEHTQRQIGEDTARPLTQLESQIVYGMYCFATFTDFAREVMKRRNKSIKRSTARIGLIRWACMSLFQDYIAQLGPEARETLTRRAHNMQLAVTVRRVTERTQDGWKFCRDEDIEAMAYAAWHGTCEFCALRGVDAKKCKLRKTLDALQILEPSSDNKDCWYRAD